MNKPMLNIAACLDISQHGAGSIKSPDESGLLRSITRNNFPDELAYDEKAAENLKRFFGRIDSLKEQISNWKGKRFIFDSCAGFETMRSRSNIVASALSGYRAARKPVDYSSVLIEVPKPPRRRVGKNRKSLAVMAFMATRGIQYP